MDYSSELKNKIQQARSFGNRPWPELPYSNFKTLIEQRCNDDRIWLIYRDLNNRRTELSYRAFCDLVIRLAHFMINKGLRDGDSIATVSHNHWHTVVQYFAAWLIGVVVVPINVGEDDERISYILDNAGVKLTFIRDEYEDQMQSIIHSRASLSQIETCICSDSLDPFLITGNLEDLPTRVEGESDALIVYTSGTTGNPKGVLLSQNNLMEDARSISEWHRLNDLSTMMCVLPIHHVNGTVVTLVTPFYAGCSVVLNQKFSVAQFFSVINEENVNIVSVVPTLLQFLSYGFKDKDIPQCPTLTHIICGAGPLTVGVARHFEGTFNIPIIHGYGLSETTCYSCYLPLDLPADEHNRWMRDYGYPSIGIPLPVNDMQIHDSSGNPLNEDEKGEIVIRGPNVMKEYYANELANKNAFTYGWFRSGDEGFFKYDGEGRPYFFITGRLKELIIRGGINLSPLEIDEVISKAPGVETGITVGFENDWYGEEVGAYVKMKEDQPPDAQAILDYCRSKLPFSKSPKVVVFGDQIPVTSTGKYQRLKVSSEFNKWKGTQFKK
ncbi:MAG: class I adenylate-forming enzyme family protein [Balneolales bacterium]